MDKYLNRQEAGLILADQLESYAHTPNLLVLALPRGGVPVAYEIAKRLKAPLDVFIVRKLGVPTHEELAMGAIAMGGCIVLNEEIIRELRISPTAIKRVAAAEKMELARREKVYRGSKAFPDMKDKTIILVDDGIATGATILAAIQAIRKEHPAKLIAAVPVAEKSIVEKIAAQVDLLICPLQPLYFYAVGSWYETFEQTADEEVLELLHKANSPL